MTPQDWSQIRFFSPAENWGSADKMNFGLLWLLDSFREHHGKPIFITCGTQGMHAKNSYHYSGCAIDCIVECGKASKLDVIFSLMKFPITGLGFYPDWRYHKFSKPLGVHMDCRPVQSLPRGITMAQWVGVKNASGGNDYLPLNEDVLRKHNII